MVLEEWRTHSVLHFTGENRETLVSAKLCVDNSDKQKSVREQKGSVLLSAGWRRERR